MIVELKYNKDADTAIDQIHRKEYQGKVLEYTDNLLLVGINYDKKTKKHTCVIEKYAEKQVVYRPQYLNPSRVHIYNMTEDKRLFHTIARELADVNNILSKMAAIGKDGLSLKELLILSEFCARYLNTAKLIESAEELAHIDALLLQSDAQELSHAVDDFMKILPSAEKDLYAIDVKQELDAYDKEQAIPYDTEREKAQSLWKQSGELDMRLFCRRLGNV